MIIERDNATQYESKRVQNIYCKLKKRLKINDQFCINYLGNKWVQVLVYEVFYNRLDFENLVYNVEKEIKKLGLKIPNGNLLTWQEILEQDARGY